VVTRNIQPRLTVRTYVVIGLLAMLQRQSADAVA